MNSGTPRFIGGRLREAREARGLTAISLAEILRVSRQAVSQYENGHQTPRPEVMERAIRSLNLAPDFFTRPIMEQTHSRKVFYRSMSTATKMVRTRVERRYDWLTDIVKYLQRFVTFPQVVFPSFDTPADPSEISWEDIERWASDTRAFWGMGDGPISNVTWLLENKGAVVSRGIIGADTLDAFSEWHIEQDRPYIFLGADKDSGPRSRYDAAHELGHLVLHRNVGVKHVTNQTTFRLIEDQAHRFASAFLLPASAFANDFSVPTLNTFRSLKPKWKVSIAMMIYRYHELNLIGDDEATRLWKNRARRKWIKKEPLDDHLPIERPRLLRRVFELVVNEGIQTRADIRNTLPYSTNDIEELANLPSGYLEDTQPPISLKTYERKRSGRSRKQSAKPGDIVEFKTGTNGDAS